MVGYRRSRLTSSFLVHAKVMTLTLRVQLHTIPYISAHCGRPRVHATLDAMAPKEWITYDTPLFNPVEAHSAWTEADVKAILQNCVSKDLRGV